MKRDERIEIVKINGIKEERKVTDVVKYLGRSDLPKGTRIVHHRKTGGKTWFIKGERGWSVERITYA